MNKSPRSSRLLESRHGKKEDDMSETTEEQVATGPDPRTILCRVVDVEIALGRSFQRFVEEQKGSLEDLMNLAREEFSKMELFTPSLGESQDPREG